MEISSGEKVLDGIRIDDFNIGEDYVLLDEKNCSKIFDSIKDLNLIRLTEIIDSEEFQEADIYWDEVWKDEASKDELVQYVLDFIELIKMTKQNNGVILMIFN